MPLRGMRPPKPCLDLYDFDGAGTIIPWPSGVMISNQCGGHCCLHPEIEGVFVPFGSGDPQAEFSLYWASWIRYSTDPDRNITVPAQLEDPTLDLIWRTRTLSIPFWMDGATALSGLTAIVSRILSKRGYGLC